MCLGSRNGQPRVARGAILTQMLLSVTGQRRPQPPGHFTGHELVKFLKGQAYLSTGVLEALMRRYGE